MIQFLVALFLISACGYTVQDSHNVRTAVGTGEQTIFLDEISQSSVYPWVPYYVQSKMHDEVNFRHLAKWAPKDEAQYLMKVSVPRFTMSAALSGASARALNTASVTMRVSIFDREGALVWASGGISVNERFLNTDETDVFKDLITRAVRKCLDNLQTKF